MEGEATMLNQLLSLFPLHSSTFSLLHHTPPSPSLPRCHSFNLDENLTEANVNTAIMPAINSRNFQTLEPLNPPPSKKPRKARKNRPRSSRSSEAMNEQIWTEFPDDLIEPVIARLPITSFFRLRSVCKKWNALLSSQSFSHHYAQVPQSQQPWFYTVIHGNLNSGAIYDPKENRWLHVNVPKLPRKVNLLPIASAGGLVCLVDFGHRYFYVCNPFTRSWKELPVRSYKFWSWVAVGMVVTRDSTGSGYKIMWVDGGGEFGVYDSSKNSWARPADFPSSFKLPWSLNFKSPTVSIGSTVYFIRGSDPEGLVSYDMETGVWKELPVPFPVNSTDHALAEFEGRIMLVGLLTKNSVTCACVWELQKMVLLWKEVDRMPNIWCLEFYGKQVKMNCLGNRGLLMLSLSSQKMNRVVTYDVSTKKWVMVPGCVPPWGRNRRWVVRGTSFYPCLTAVP